MTLPTYKKLNFERMDDKKQTLSQTIEADDKQSIMDLMSLMVQNKDARGQWQIPRKQGMELLVYFRKYVDPKVSNNIFGCGGCAQKIVNYMFDIYSIWQNPIK